MHHFCAFFADHANMARDTTKCNENELVERAAGPQVSVECIVLHRFASLFRFFALPDGVATARMRIRSFSFPSSWLAPRRAVAIKAVCLIRHMRSAVRLSLCP